MGRRHVLGELHDRRFSFCGKRCAGGARGRPDRYDAGFEGSEVNSAGDSSTELRNHEGGGQATDAKTGGSTRTNIKNRSREGSSLS